MFYLLFHNVGQYPHKGYEAEMHLKTFEQIGSVPIFCMDCPTELLHLHIGIYTCNYLPPFIYTYTKKYTHEHIHMKCWIQQCSAKINGKHDTAHVRKWIPYLSVDIIFECFYWKCSLQEKDVKVILYQICTLTHIHCNTSTL